MTELTINQALEQAAKARKSGQIREAKRIYETILAKSPKNKRAIKGLKELTAMSFGKAPEVQDSPRDQIQSLISLYNHGQFALVFERAQILTKHYPNALAIWNLMGVSAAQIGQLRSAIFAFERMLVIKPDHTEAHYNMANAYKLCGELEKAINAYKKSLVIKPGHAEAYYNMANAYKEHDKLEEALKAYVKTVEIKADHAGAYNNMGITLQKLGKAKEAIETYGKALAIKPDHVVYNNMGASLQEYGKLEQAIQAHMKALSLKPDYTDAWLNGAEALEKWNKLKQLSLWLEKAFQTLDTIPSDILFMKAKLLWRTGNNEEAIKLILKINLETIAPVRKQDFLHLKAKCFEALKNYDSAYDCFKHMNLFTVKTNEYLRLDPERYLQNIREQLVKLKSTSSDNLVTHSEERDDFAPVFLVGFPRSGTTLLDTILRSHSKIDVVEEQPLVSAAQSFVLKSGYYDLVNTLPNEVISGAKKAYVAELNKHRAQTVKKSVLVDKLPLNLLQIPLIRQLFPRSRFILSLRHPMDAILSCWMQNFKLNPAMANMVDLERVVEFYCVAMEIFKICRIKYNLLVHEIRYEDLVEDFQHEALETLSFLNLKWESQLESYQETALKRGRITTPSYSQVVKPIYKDAKYRWLNYDKHLRQYIPEVEPWIYEFGYNRN